PAFDYLLLDTPKGALIVVSELATSCLERYGLVGTTLASAKGAALEHIRLEHPFQPRTVPIICGEHVTTEAGTGLVHTAPAHGTDDYLIGKRYALAVNNPVANDGRFLASTPDLSVGALASKTVWEANPLVIAELTARERLLKAETLRHSYPHCWRHKSPIIFRATTQWFIGMEQSSAENADDSPNVRSSLRNIAERAVDATQFFPAWGRARLEGMMKTRPDWCISRQRNWGVPIPFFLHKESGALHPRTAELIEQVATQVEQSGIEAWFSLDSRSLLGDEAEAYEKMSDTLDVWFDSGVTHWSILRSQQAKADQAGSLYPADLYLEGSDQHRGWFQSSLLTGCALDGQAPYKALLTHGFVVDGNGRKMSKSIGNVIAPQKISDTLGADILRLWVAATDYSGELSISDEILKRVVEAYRRMRNTLRFLLANTADFDAQKDLLPIEQWLEIDRYALVLTQQLQTRCVADYARYELHPLVQALQNFCSEELGSFYLDILKDRLYTTAAGSRARRSAQSALWHILRTFAQLIAPILPFTAEEVWQLHDNKASTAVEDGSIMLHTWHSLPVQNDAEALLAKWGKIRAYRSEVVKALENLRVEGKIGSSLQAAVTLRAQGEKYALLASLGDELRFVLICSQSTLLLAEAKAEDELLCTALSHEKCGRCWHVRADVGSHPEHPELCARCIDNLYGQGEQRAFA
ncbi:MAG: class I tRNA ligase family protein, partial [Pseudomonadota bacterium]